MKPINPFDHLPLELVAYVLDFLEGDDLKVAELSCQRFRGLISGPNCIPQFRVRKYLWILPSAPQRTFQEQCVWANGVLKRILQFVKMGMQQVRHSLFKVNDDVYLTIVEGQFKLIITSIRQCGPAEVSAFKPAIGLRKDYISKGYPWLIQYKDEHDDKFYTRLVSMAAGYKDYNRRCNFSSYKKAFRKAGYVRIINQSDRHETFYLKEFPVSYNPYKGITTCIIFRKGKFKKLCTSKIDHQEFDGEITEIASLKKDQVSFKFENGAFELLLSIKNVENKMQVEVRRLKRIKDIIPELKIRAEGNFTIGGKNRVETILYLKRLNGLPIPVQEQRLRCIGRGDNTLGSKESLLQSMARDQQVVDALEITHQELILPAVRAIALASVMHQREFQFNDETYLLCLLDVCHSNNYSLFGDPCPYPIQGIIFTKESTKEKLSMVLKMVDSIRRYGFYGGVGGHYHFRVSPERIASFFWSKELVKPIPYKMTTKYGVILSDETGTVGLQEEIFIQIKNGEDKCGEFLPTLKEPIKKVTVTKMNSQLIFTYRYKDKSVKKFSCDLANRNRVKEIN